MQYEKTLYHYGVLGMKWGHHKRRVDESSHDRKIREQKEELKKAKKEYNKKTLYGAITPSTETFNKLQKAKLKYQYAVDDKKSKEILDKLSSKEKSKQQLKMEEKYKAKGMSDKEAAVAAYNNIRSKKILATVGGITLAAAGAYAGHKLIENRVDKIIKSGTVLQNITTDSDKSIRDTFYSAKNNYDKNKYKGLLGSTFKKEGSDVYSKNVKVLSDIKMASHHNAKKGLTELFNNDKDFAKQLIDNINNVDLGVTYAKQIDMAKKNLAKGVVDKNVYDVFNASLVYHDPKFQSVADKYYSNMAKKGYNAIKDMNDYKYSGYESLNPIITFCSKNKVTVDSVRELTSEEIKKANNLDVGLTIGKEVLKVGATTTAGILGVNAAGKKLSDHMIDKKVSKYLEEHPNSDLSVTDLKRKFEMEAFNEHTK